MRERNAGFAKAFFACVFLFWVVVAAHEQSWFEKYRRLETRILQPKEDFEKGFRGARSEPKKVRRYFGNRLEQAHG